MSISGSLEDVSVADVMQFIHLGRRTGTLVLEHDGESAQIGFHAGRLVSARGPNHEKIGDLLVAAGAVDQQALDSALAAQRSGLERRSLGQILLAEGSVAPQELRAVIVQQIESTVSEAMGWSRGSFHFSVDGLQALDDIGLFPAELVPGPDVNTQMILLEAARIFDERNRAGSAVPPASAAEEPGAIPDAEAFRTRLGIAEEPPPVATPASGRPALEVRVEPADPALVELVTSVAPRLALRIDVQTGLDRLGPVEPGEEAPIALVDLRRRREGLADLARLHRDHPRVQVVALVAGERSAAGAYEAGAMAVLPGPAALPACLENLVAGRLAARAAWREEAAAAAPATAVARLRRIVDELRSGFISATAALSLMHIISESVERAVLLLARNDGLTVLGAFGAAPDGRPLAELTRGLKVGLDPDHPFGRCLVSADARTLDFDDLPVSFASAVGRPSNGQGVLFPVRGARRMIAVVYADNAERPEPVEDIAILEIATAQVGMAFENELLRRNPAPAGI